MDCEKQLFFFARIWTHYWHKAIVSGERSTQMTNLWDFTNVHTIKSSSAWGGRGYNKWQILLNSFFPPQCNPWAALLPFPKLVPLHKPLEFQYLHFWGEEKRGVDIPCLICESCQPPPESPQATRRWWHCVCVPTESVTEISSLPSCEDRTHGNNFFRATFCFYTS